MQGDFTRFTFDPKKGYTKVLKQQGRVDVDADANEQAFITEHLERTARMDLAGVECGAPGLKPGFAISLTASGTDLDISAGRFYAHGLICELFNPTTYLTQPFRPLPQEPLPLKLNPVDGQTDLVYLDVWQRHVTALEDPTIREVALGGPDTTTRAQTIFQVRIAANVGAVSCPDAPLPSPGGALLTSSVVPVPPEDDPCAIGPSGGFKGLENRLYRAEIHDPGALGVATFKWSRDNGSVVFAVQEFVAGQPNKVRVSRLGRDQVLALQEGDFVEVFDDNAELSNTPGTVVKITSIDRANRELTLSGPVTGDPNAHPKVRRWDQKSAPIVTAAGPIVLEDGIQVQFAGTEFKTADHWMFFARVATGKVQELNNAPAQGIKHHYCRLALITWSAPPGGPVTAKVSDCRTIFPAGGTGCCCCTVTVGDGAQSHGDFTDIQQAIDSLPKDDQVFGIVCILPGTYKLKGPVTVKRPNLRIQGCGRDAVIHGPPEEMAFLVHKADNVTLQSLFIILESNYPAIVSRAARELTVADCLIDGGAKGVFSIAVQATVAALTGNSCRGGIIIMDNSNRVRVSDNRLEHGRSPGVALGGKFDPDFPMEFPGDGLAEIEVRDNQIRDNGGSGICTLFGSFPDNPEFGPVRGLTIAGNVIERNALDEKVVKKMVAVKGAAGGIVLQHAQDVRILENQVVRNGGRGQPACGIFLQQCLQVDVADNTILDNGSTQGVINQECIDFRTMPVGQPPVIPPQSGVKFTFLNGAGQPIGPGTVQNSLGATGLRAATTKLVIDLPAADSVDITLLPYKTTLQATALAGATQVDGHTIASGPETHLLLSGPGITKVVLEAEEALFVVLEFCRLTSPIPTEFQGGLLALLMTTSVRPLDKMTFPAGQSAIRVHDNVINTPAGHSLLISARGPVSVAGNSLTTCGARFQPLSHLINMQAFGVVINNIGHNYAPKKKVFIKAPLAPLMALAGADPAGFAESEIVFDGRVLFHGNQVTLRAFNGRVPDGSWACGIVTKDACQIANNQFNAEAPGTVLGADLVAQGDTVSAVGNNFAELPHWAQVSFLGTGRHALASLNQAMHCVIVHGYELEDVANNQVTIASDCDELRKQILTFL
jgi:hypothetical protein